MNGFEMKNFPESFSSQKELDEFINTPSSELVEYFRSLEGDVMVLGGSGKMGPAVSMMAKKAAELSGVDRNIYAVARSAMPQLEAAGIKTFQCDLLDIEQLEKLPKAKNIIYLVGLKFGSTGNEGLTWAINTVVPSNVGRVFSDCNIVALSTGCVYPVADISSLGCSEMDKPSPVGEYAMSCLGRERVFDYYSDNNNFNIVHIRLNYSLDLRYGVLVDIARKVYEQRAVDLTSGYFNGIWQGDACDQILRAISLAGKPGTVLNITGPETLSVRQAAREFGQIFEKEPIFEGVENGKSYLSNASKANGVFGNPRVPISQIIKWTAKWVEQDGEDWGKPTHFEVQNGKY